MATLTEAQLIQLMQPDLPIKAYPTRGLMANLRDKYAGMEMSISTLFEIHSLVDLGNEGGVGCEIAPFGQDRAKLKVAVICSITHLVIKRGEPHYAEIVGYQVKRVKKLERQKPRFFGR